MGRLTPAGLCAGMGALVVVLAGLSLHAVAGSGWLGQLGGVAPTGITRVIVDYSWWPRLVVSLLAGAGLGLAGVLMQQTLRNPLAAPTTLGLGNGAQLALLLATLFAPSWLDYGRGSIAFVGSALTIALVFVLASRRALAPTVLVLAGLVVNLYVGALILVLMLFNADALKGLMVWGAGSLTQNNWDSVVYLLPRLLAAGVGAAVLLRPLAMLDLEETNARNLGVSLAWLRLAGLGLAVFITAAVVAQVGLIVFIGLAAPAIVRLVGARTMRGRLIWAPVFGALLLTAIDLIVQLSTSASATLVPTGATTAVLGAPLLLWLIPRLSLNRRSPQSTPPPPVGRLARPWRMIGLLCVAVVVVAILGLLAGQGAAGWNWPFALPWSESGHWRLPRVLAAGSAGVMLAMAGTILQRVSGNPMASPEVLGVTAGTGMGLLAMAWLVPAAGTGWMLGAGTLGALLTLMLLIVLNFRSRFEPEQLLLSGISMMFLFDAIVRLALAGNDPRGEALVAWISGSTYYVSLHGNLVIGGVGLVAILLAWPLARWLDVLPLGEPVARSLGIPVTGSRLWLLVLVAVLTAAATLVVGPLSFVGLLAPHLARLLGLARARSQMAGAMALGAALLILADWVGREVLFPMEIPAGLVATIIGGSYFMWRLRRV